ncbi:MAG: hypothetical protein WBA01_10220, partial [Phormidesmis sp.]
GSFESHAPQTLLCMVGSGLTAVYFLLMINRVFFGRLTAADDGVGGSIEITLPKVSWRDRGPAIALVLTIFAFGLQPEWMTRWIESTTTAFVPQAIRAATLVSQPAQATELAFQNAPKVIPKIAPEIIPKIALKTTPNSVQPNSG